MPLQGEDLKEFKEAMEGLEMLVVDEFSMVSRLVLQQMHERLREWRLAEGQVELASQPFGGIAVILAGDMGQLPPIAVSPSFSLLNTSNVHDAREQKLLNHGKRLLQKFTTVVRLRRIHRQPGVSPYKESLIRLRDAAMTEEDHELWRQHNLETEVGLDLPCPTTHHRLAGPSDHPRLQVGAACAMLARHLLALA